MLKKIIIRIMSITVACLLLTLPVANTALAAPTTVVFTVNSTLDLPDDLTIPGVCHTAANTCTLRAAIMQANRPTGERTIIDIPPGIYKLTIPAVGTGGEQNGDLDLTTPVSGSPLTIIRGDSADTTIIDADQRDRVFHVHPGRDVDISLLTIRNGYLVDAFEDGGGIQNEGHLVVSRTSITNNNVSASFNFGGGIHNSGSLEVRNSTIFGNGAYNGGGIYTFGAEMFVVNSTISQNYANNDGGGIYKYGTTGMAALYNTTIFDNDADHDRDENGGIGGGIFNAAGSRFLVVNTLIAGNTVFNAPIYNDCSGMLEAYGFNLIFDETGCTFSGNGTASRGFVSLDTIGPLRNNGGPTWTHALLAGSAAIDTTLDSLGCVDRDGLSLYYDQRDVRRPAGARCDVGAFEYYPPIYVYLPAIQR